MRNSYSVGNGGLISIEIHDDDDSAEHLPTGKALGRIQEPFVPMERQSANYPSFDFQTPVRIEKGRLYHLVFRQLNPPRRCAIGGESPTRAKDCDRDAGAVGLNGIHFVTGTASDQGGPYLGTTEANFIRNSDHEPWRKDPDGLSWYSLQYSDGQWVGHSMDFFKGITENLFRAIDGTQVRQRFLNYVDDIEIGDVWVRVHRQSQTLAGKLHIRITDEKNSSIGETVIDGLSIPECSYCGGNWVHATFPPGVRLRRGETYSVVFAAIDGGDFRFPTGIELSFAPYNAQSETYWSDSRVERSGDHGKTWSVQQNDPYANERDLSMLLAFPLNRRSLNRLLTC
jgi:hypothetical protein